MTSLLFLLYLLLFLLHIFCQMTSWLFLLYLFLFVLSSLFYQKKHMILQGGNSAKNKASHIVKSLLPWDTAVEFSWFRAKEKKILRIKYLLAHVQ